MASASAAAAESPPPIPPPVRASSVAVPPGHLRCCRPSGPPPLPPVRASSAAIPPGLLRCRRPSGPPPLASVRASSAATHPSGPPPPPSVRCIGCNTRILPVAENPLNLQTNFQILCVLFGGFVHISYISQNPRLVMKPFKKLAKWFLGCFNCTGSCTTNVVCCGGVATNCTRDDLPNHNNEAKPVVPDLISL